MATFNFGLDDSVRSFILARLLNGQYVEWIQYYNIGYTPQSLTFGCHSFPTFFFPKSSHCPIKILPQYLSFWMLAQLSRFFVIFWMPIYSHRCFSFWLSIARISVSFSCVCFLSYLFIFLTPFNFPFVTLMCIYQIDVSRQLLVSCLIYSFFSYVTHVIVTFFPLFTVWNYFVNIVLIMKICFLSCYSQECCS